MKYSPSRSIVRGVLGSAAAASLFVSAVRADGGNETAPVANPASSTTETVASGMTVAKDKKTGEIRPATAKEMKKLAKMAAASDVRAGKGKEAPVVRQLPNGTLALTVDPSFDVYSVAVKGADGKVHTTCVPGEQVAATLEKMQAAGSTKKEVLDEK